jgi:hypothetical protein
MSRVERVGFELPVVLKPIKPVYGPYLVFYVDDEGWAFEEFSSVEAARSFIKSLGREDYAPYLIVRVIGQWRVKETLERLKKH